MHAGKKTAPKKIQFMKYIIFMVKALPKYGEAKLSCINNAITISIKNVKMKKTKCFKLSFAKAKTPFLILIGYD
jgi:hypothetical protein